MQRECPACGELMDADPRRRYCSGSCRTWVWRVGGALAAADLREGMARDWLALGRNAYHRNAAAECRRSAELLRQVHG